MRCVKEAAAKRLGNSRGVIIPKPLLAQVGLTDEAEMKVENGAIVLRPATRPPREGWAEASRAIAADEDESLVWPELANEGGICAGDADQAAAAR